MSYYSNRLTAVIIDKYRKKSKRENNKKRLKYNENHFECSSVSFLPIFIIGILFFAVLLIVCTITNLNNINEVLGAIWVFVLFIAFFAIVAWVCEHQKLTVDGDEAVYTNIWGFKRHFRVSEITKCLTTEQSIFLYVGNKKVATLDHDMHCLDFFIIRCNKEGIKWEPKSKRIISKFTLVWNASRTLTYIFIGFTIFITALLLPIELLYNSDLIEILEIEAVIIGFFGLTTIAIMICNMFGLKEVRHIEKALDISFNEEMKLRRAIGREYKDTEWFVEAIPGKIEVLNRRFIKKWCGIKKEDVSGNTIYHVEFIDINDKLRKIGGHYSEYAQEMNQWYKS